MRSARDQFVAARCATSAALAPAVFQPFDSFSQDASSITGLTRIVHFPFEGLHRVFVVGRDKRPPAVLAAPPSPPGARPPADR